MNIYEKLLRKTLEEEHAKVGLDPKFTIFEMDPSLYEISIELDENKTWEEQSKSIEAMVEVRSKLLKIMSFNYSYAPKLS